jgi:plasmid stabilization system protein ParE
MAYTIKINRRFEIKVAQTYEYLAKEWGFTVADAFYNKIIQKIDTLQSYPFIGKMSKKKPDIRRILVTKHNILYYRIDGNTIVIINLLSTKRNPKQNPYD